MNGSFVASRWVPIAVVAVGVAVACGGKSDEDLFAGMGGRIGRGGSVSGGATGGSAGPSGGTDGSAGATGGTAAPTTGGSAPSGGAPASTGGKAPVASGGSNAPGGSSSSGGVGEAGAEEPGAGGVAGSSDGATGGDAGVAGSEQGGAPSNEGGAANSAGSGGEAPGAGGAGAGSRTIQIDDLFDAYVDGCETTHNTGSEATLSVDTDPCIFEIYLKPAALSDIPAGARLESALLELECIDAGDAVQVLRLTDDWSEDSVDWDTRPSVGDELGSFLAAEGPVVIDLTSLVAEWLEGAPIYGVALVQTETDGSDFHSSESGEAGAPRLLVTYTP